MKIIEIQQSDNGSHRNQIGVTVVPDGWAVVPDDMETEHFPFGNIEVEVRDDVYYVSSWVPRDIPDVVNDSVVVRSETDKLLDILLGVEE